jgi:hypothetical protein
MKRIVMTMLVYVLFLAGMGAQAEFNIKAGVESWQIKDEKELVGNSSHPGQFIGFDMFIENNRLLFTPGFHYHHISVTHQEESLVFGFDKRNHFHYFTIPMTAGYKFIDVGVLNVSLMAGAEVSFFFDIDENDIDLDDDQVHGVWTAWTGILHTEIIDFVTAEIKYHSAFHPIIKERSESKLQGITLAIGFKF